MRQELGWKCHKLFFEHDILMVRHYGFNELMPYFPYFPYFPDFLDFPDFAGDRDTIPLM